MDVILIVILIVFFIGMTVALLSSNDSDGIDRAEQKQWSSAFEQDNLIMEQENVSRTQEYVYHNALYTRMLRFVVDDNNKQVLVSQPQMLLQKIPFSEIIGCEILTDSQVTGGVGRAIVGSMIAGDVGAVVGAVTAKPHVMTYQIVIYRKNMTYPKLTLNVITSKTKTNSDDYRNAVQFASSVNSSIKAIMSLNAESNKNDSEVDGQTASGKSNAAANASVADELIKLKGLLDAGVLTQEEFDAQKAKLLS